MDTISRGKAAEAAVLLRLVRANIRVMLPFGDGAPFDLAAELGDERIVKIQVKSGSVRNDCVEFNAGSTDHGKGRVPYRGRADLIAVYAWSLDRVFMLSVDDCPVSKGCLRLVPSRNNQRAGVRMADQYDFQRWAEAVMADTHPPR